MYILHQPLNWCMQYRVMLDCVITALGCIKLKHFAFEIIWIISFSQKWWLTMLQSSAYKPWLLALHKHSNCEIRMVEHNRHVGNIWEVPFVISSFALFPRNTRAAKTDPLSDPDSGLPRKTRYIPCHLTRFSLRGFWWGYQLCCQLIRSLFWKSLGSSLDFSM